MDARSWHYWHRRLGQGCHHGGSCESAQSREWICLPRRSYPRNAREARLIPRSLFSLDHVDHTLLDLEFPRGWDQQVADAIPEELLHHDPVVRSLTGQ